MKTLMSFCTREMGHKMTIYELIGVFGFLGYISCFICVQLSLVRAPSVRFSLWNLTSASLVLVSLSENFNLAAAMIQTSWIAISLAALYGQLVRPRWKRARENGSRGRRVNVGTVLAGGCLILLGIPSTVGNDYDAQARFAVMKTEAMAGETRDFRIVYAAMVD